MLQKVSLRVVFVKRHHNAIAILTIVVIMTIIMVSIWVSVVCIVFIIIVSINEEIFVQFFLCDVREMAV